MSETDKERPVGIRRKLDNLLNGDGKSAYVYGRIMTVLIIASMLPLCFKEMPLAILWIERVCIAVFILDYALRWTTSDIKLNRGVGSFVIYPFTPMAIIDLLSILPAFFVALNPALRTLRVFRLFRAVRAFRLVRYSKGFNAIAATLVKQRQSLLVTLGLAAGYVLVCALVIFNVEPDTFESFFEAVYWAVVSLTTVGYGDLYPTTVIGRSIAMLSSLMGIAIVALPAGIITAGLLDELREKQHS